MFDPLYLPYPSRRAPVIARRGMVATSQPLAAQAGLAILRRGGNAVDAAIATAAALTVVEPTSNGIGSDAFAIVWAEGGLRGLNASGPAPRSLTLEAVRSAGYESMPKHGFLPVTVPGAPAAWAELSKRFGKLPFAELLQPAISYAQEGYPLSPTLGEAWAKAFKGYAETLHGDEFAPLFETFAPAGRVPAIGEMWRSEGHARTLSEIAETKAESFYRGGIAEKIGAFSERHGGYLRAEDLAAFRPEWVDPVSVHYHGTDVYELPPNGHGIVALMALQILAGMDDTNDPVERMHRAIEALKLAYVDGKAYIADPRSMSHQVADLISAEYAAERRALIGDMALDPAPGKPPRGGTVYLCAADGDGMMVSYIQSNYMGFGSGIVIPDTGISLQNRGNLFSLDASSDNRLQPGMRPYQTIIPGFLMRDGKPLGPFGVMGGFMQPQGHMQVVMHVVDENLNPQAALDAPRWQWLAGKTIELEHGIPEHLALALRRRGHDIRRAVGSTSFGRGEMIWRLPSGVLVGATEPRTDGQVAAW